MKTQHRTVNIKSTNSVVCKYIIIKLVNLSLKQLRIDAKLETGKGVKKTWLNGKGHYGGEGQRWVVAPSDNKEKKKIK